MIQQKSLTSTVNFISFYEPHAYLIVTWTLAYIIFFRVKFFDRGFGIIIFGYGCCEVILDTILNLQTLIIHQFNVPLITWILMLVIYPIALFCITFGLILGQPHLHVPVETSEFIAFEILIIIWCALLFGIGIHTGTNTLANLIGSIITLAILFLMIEP